jgi:hypothetical protein
MSLKIGIIRTGCSHPPLKSLQRASEGLGGNPVQSPQPLTFPFGLFDFLRVVAETPFVLPQNCHNVHITLKLGRLDFL